MTYIGTFKNNKAVIRNTLEEIVELPHVQYIFKKEEHSKIHNTTYDGSRALIHFIYKYTPINPDGSTRLLSIGKFDLVVIEPDRRYYKHFEGRTIKIYDRAKKSLREFTSMIENENFITDELLPLFDILKQTNSWDIYLQLSEIKELKILIEKQRIEIKELKSKIQLLQK